MASQAFTIVRDVRKANDLETVAGDIVDEVRSLDLDILYRRCEGRTQ